jgi:ferrous-iron efflux pump FieF
MGMHHHHHGHDHGHSHGLDLRAFAGDHGQLMRRATYASVTISTILLVAKLVTWLSTDSLAMLSSFTDSVFDMVSSVINLLAVRYALKPADDDHRFGHTSIEDIAGLAQCAFIVATMALILLQSVARIFNPQPLQHEHLGIIVSVVAMVLTTGLVLFQTYVTRRTRSLVVSADRLHYAGDILFNLGVLAAFWLTTHYSIIWADPAIAIIITVVVLWSSKSIGIRAFNNLMDREMPEAEKEKILAILDATPGVLGHHKMKTRYAGLKAFLQLHVEIDATLNFRDAHAITDQLEKSLEAAFPDAEVIIHPDPKEPKNSPKTATA